MRACLTGITHRLTWNSTSIVAGQQEQKRDTELTEGICAIWKDVTGFLVNYLRKQDTDLTEDDCVVWREVSRFSDAIVLRRPFQIASQTRHRPHRERMRSLERRIRIPCKLSPQTRHRPYRGQLRSLEGGITANKTQTSPRTIA